MKTTFNPEIKRYYLKVGDMVLYGNSQTLAEVKQLNLSHEDPNKRVLVLFHEVIWGINAQAVESLECSLERLLPANIEEAEADHRRYCPCLPSEFEKITVTQSLGEIVVIPSLNINDKVLVKPNFNREAIILKIEVIGDSFLYTVSGSKVPELFYYFDLIKLP